MAMALRQALKKTRQNASFYNMLCFFFFIITLATLNTPALADQIYHSSPPPSTLVVYDSDVAFPYQTSFVVVASPSGNLSSLEFGTISVLSNTLREGEATDSPLLGVINGQFIVERDFSLYTTVTFVLNYTDSFSGSISAQGVLDQSVNAEPRGELTITGGTYDFRWARGYVEISSNVAQGPQGTVSSKFILHIKYD